MTRHALPLGALLAGLSVAAGAFGAHALRGRLDAADLATFETAARYQMYHALALLLAGWQAARFPGRAVSWAVRGFVAGIVLFSGSLYALVLLDLRWMGAITPLGGLAFVSGWASLAVAFASSRNQLG